MSEITRNIIRNIREDNDLSQAKVAEFLNITQQYYSKYELGDYELPLRHLIKLGEFYNVSTDYLIGKTKYKNTYDELNKKVIKNKTIGELINDIITLDSNSRKFIIEFIELMKVKQDIIKK